MSSNIMEQYIKNTKKFLEEFSKYFLAERYDKNISNEFIESYVDARIHNFGEKDKRFFYSRVYAFLLEKKEEIEEKTEEKKEKKDKKELYLDDYLKMYQLIFFIDGVRPMADLKETIKLICQKRQDDFLLRKVTGLENNLFKLSKKYLDEKENCLTPYDTKDFELDITKYTLVDNTYKVSLVFNFRIPYIYSKKVINEVYNEGIVYEDKLMIEYLLLSIRCIKDIEDGDFDTKYLVEFATSIFSKQNKLKQSLKILDDVAIQDKVFLKIKYKDFEENKELIYELMKDGYRFALILDDSFKVNAVNYKKLTMFEYILISESSKVYQKIKYEDDKIGSTIIYDK